MNDNNNEPNLMVIELFITKCTGREGGRGLFILLCPTLFNALAQSLLREQKQHRYFENYKILLSQDVKGSK